jgi:hypothetical protein
MEVMIVFGRCCGDILMLFIDPIYITFLLENQGDRSLCFSAICLAKADQHFPMGEDHTLSLIQPQLESQLVLIKLCKLLEVIAFEEYYSGHAFSPLCSFILNDKRLSTKIKSKEKPGWGDIRADMEIDRF